MATPRVPATADDLEREATGAALAETWTGSDDPLFAEPYVDLDEWRTSPAPHRYVHGGFVGTDTRFSYYLPPVDRYGGRFVQHATPVPQSEQLLQLDPPTLSFAFASGAYAVETNGGGPGYVDPFSDPTVYAYRANAAAAEFSKHVAQIVYGEHRVHGYLWGGSGGAFRTIACAENTVGVWDGFAPLVQGSPMSLPNVFTVRMHAQRVLRDKLDGIVDALEPGGSGDPYADLDDEEAAAFTEVTRMGFPPRSWFAHPTMGTQAFTTVFPLMQYLDPGYFVDFWTRPGYLGADPTNSVRSARVVHPTTVAAVASADEPGVAARLPIAHQPAGGTDESWHGSQQTTVAAVRLSSAPGTDTQVAELTVRSGAAAGARLMVRSVEGTLAVFDYGNDPVVLAQLRLGDEVTIDNSNVLAAQTYHRHQVPPGDDYPVWDQFRTVDGTPRYPQRPVIIGPLMARGATGTDLSGRFAGKMIAISCLLDREAYAWQADWYRRKIIDHLGDRADASYRLWYVDNGVHGDSIVQDDPRHTVSYGGMVYQALRDLAAWVEDGIEPPTSTRYEIVDGQVRIPTTAGERRGIQPVVELTVDGRDRVEVSPGASVCLRVSARTPEGTGVMVGADWDLDDTGVFAVQTAVEPAAELELVRDHTFTERGTHFVNVLVTARRGDASTSDAPILNLARARVVVR